MEFIKNFKQYQSELTKYNVLSQLRRYIRKLNNEPNLDFKTKIKVPTFPNKKNNKISFCIEAIASKLRKKQDKRNLLILYLLYFGGLNFSYVSRIMIKDIKSHFTILKLNKGAKKRVHAFLNIIKNLLFDYFLESGTNSSRYLFYDNYLGKKKVTSTQYIKNEFLISINDDNTINREEKKN